MKNILLIGGIFLLLVGAYFIYSKVEVDRSDGAPVTVDDDTSDIRSKGIARDAALGYEFFYHDGTDGYITLENNDSTDPDFVSGLTLMNWQEYEEFNESVDAREGPPAIQVLVYLNPANLHAPVWATRKPLETNIELAMGEPEEAVVGGANATHFVADGLYPIDTYVVASGGRVYVLSGAYLEKDSDIYRDFQALVDSFTFIEPGAPQGKLDIEAVCKGALAYMLFRTGEEADAFVAECIAGEHPEVIERFKADQGLDGATI